MHGTRTRILIPEPHPDQARAFALPGRFKAIRCGRRWGKTALCEMVAAHSMIDSRVVGWFSPDYKRMSEVYVELLDMLLPLKSGSSKVDKIIRLQTGGRIDFWTLDDPLAGRSRFYHDTVIDEAAFTDKKSMMETWEQAIKPTLLDYGGTCIAASNTNGDDTENFFWRICNQPELGFVEYHAPTWHNPHVPKRMPMESDAEYTERREEVYRKLRADNHPLVYSQEYEAEFVDWSGAAFFSREKLLIDGVPPPWPNVCDAVFAVIDTATKTGTDHDGTAVMYFALIRNQSYPLVILDWDLMQIEGSFLETWLPVVFQNLESMAKECRARSGSVGCWIEDKSSGMVLLQQARRRGWAASPIDSKLTAVGKSERGISVSGYVHRGEVKMSKTAFDRSVSYKSVSRNHALGQIVDFRVGDEDAKDKQDDLLDCFTYGIAIALGNTEGF